ncbi:MAG: iron ABC transporter ATP-binding protein [Rhodoglobus sp.]
MRTRLSILTAMPVAALVLLSLSACVPTEPSDPGADPTPTATASTTPSATPTTAPTAVVGIAVTVSCDQLIPAQAIYDYNPNFSLVADYKPAAGSLGAQAIADKGIACAWVNQTSGDRIEGSVAHLEDTDLTALKNNLVMTSHSVPTYQVEGYFTLDGATGVAQAFPDPYWVTLTSKVFLEPGDAQPLIAAAVTALG